MSSWLRLTLITMTVGGGFTGVALTSQILFSPQVTSAALRVICVVFLFLHLFVFVSGILFVQNPARVVPMVVAFALQMPSLSSPLMTYRFADGLYGIVGIAETGVFWRIRLGSEWQFNAAGPLPWGFGINLVAVAMFVALSAFVRRRRALTAGVSDTTPAA